MTLQSIKAGGLFFGGCRLRLCQVHPVALFVNGLGASDGQVQAGMPDPCRCVASKAYPARNDFVGDHDHASLNGSLDGPECKSGL